MKSFSLLSAVAGILCLASCETLTIVKDPITISSPTPTEQITKVILNETQVGYVEAGNQMSFRFLKQMYDDGYLTKGEYIDAIDEKIKLNEKSIKKKNYIETYLYFCATEALMEAQGFKLKYEFDSDAKREKYDKEYQEKYNECHQSLYSSGYQIYTSLDVKLQKKLQSAVNNILVDFSPTKINYNSCKLE